MSDGNTDKTDDEFTTSQEEHEEYDYMTERELLIRLCKTTASIKGIMIIYILISILAAVIYLMIIYS